MSGCRLRVAPRTLCPKSLATNLAQSHAAKRQVVDIATLSKALVWQLPWTHGVNGATGRTMGLTGSTEEVPLTVLHSSTIGSMPGMCQTTAMQIEVGRLIQDTRLNFLTLIVRSETMLSESL